MGTYWNASPSSDFCGHWTEQEWLLKGGRKARYTYSVWNRKLGSCCCFPGTKFQYSVTKVHWVSMAVVVSWFCFCNSMGSNNSNHKCVPGMLGKDLELSIFLSVLKQFLRDQELDIPEFRFLFWHCLVVWSACLWLFDWRQVTRPQLYGCV